MIPRPGACIRRRVRWWRSAVLFALYQLTPSSPAHRTRSARDLQYPSEAIGACRVLRLVGGENEAELLVGPVPATNPLIKWPAREVSAREVSAQFDRDSAVNNAALCEPITAFVDRWHISPGAPDLDAGKFKEKGCVNCNALPLLYGLCLDTYGAGWKAFLCRVCGKDFKKSRLPAVSSARSGGAGASASVHGAPMPRQQTVQVADRGQIGERRGLVEKNGVRGLKYRDIYGETLLLLHRRCHLCTRHATYGPAHSSRHEAVHCRAHKTKEEKDLVSRKCLHQGCGKRPMYGNPDDGATPHYCARHRHPGHVDMKNRKCRFGSCQKRASFALAHDAHQVPISCAEHRDSICRSYAARAHADSAVRLRRPECGGDGEGCGFAAEVGKGGAAERIRVVPIWRCNGWTEGGGAARGKAGSKDSGAICLKRPSYGSDRARTCARHRKPHYSNVYAKFCQHPEGCRRLGQRVFSTLPRSEQAASSAAERTGEEAKLVAQVLCRHHARATSPRVLLASPKPSPVRPRPGPGATAHASNATSPKTAAKDGYEETTGIGDSDRTAQGEQALAQGQVKCIETPVRHQHSGPRANRSV